MIQKTKKNQTKTKQQNPIQNQLHQFEEVHGGWRQEKGEGFTGAGTFLEIPAGGPETKGRKHEAIQETCNHQL